MAPPGVYQPTTWGASQRAVAVSRGPVVELASIERPGQLYRSYRFTEFTDFYGMRVAMSADSSRLFAVMAYAGRIHLYAVPGVGISSAPRAPNPAAGSSRNPAARAPGVTAIRTAPAQASSSPPIAMQSVTDIEFASDGSVYASDSTTGVVNRYAPDGTPIMGWRDLAGVESLAELNGVMYGILRQEGSIVRFDANVAVPTRVATGLPYASGLTAANGKLWTTYYRHWYSSKVASFDPETRAVWFQPDDYGSGFDWEQGHLAELPVAGHLLGYRTDIRSALRFDLNALAFTDDWVSITPPFAVAPDGLKIIDREGVRYTAAPFAPDGFVYPGGGHTMSGVTPSGRRLVAALSIMLATEFVVYDETNPGSIVYSEPRTFQFAVRRMEFRPGTTQLWTAVTYSGSTQVVLVPVDVGPAPYEAAMVGDDAVLEMGTVLPTNRLATAVAASEGLRSAYLQPGAPNLGPAPPSTLVGPTSASTVAVPSTLVDLTPAAALHPDPVMSTSTPAAPSSTVPTSPAPVPVSGPVSVPVSVPGSSTTVATPTPSSGALAPVAVVSAAPPTTKPSTTATRVVPARRRSAPTTTRRRIPAKRPTSAPTPKRR